jgi:hypothetical protein
MPCPGPRKVTMSRRSRPTVSTSARAALVQARTHLNELPNDDATFFADEALSIRGVFVLPKTQRGKGAA